jgi:hypothetical protein
VSDEDRHWKPSGEREGKGGVGCNCAHNDVLLLMRANVYAGRAQRLAACDGIRDGLGLRITPTTTICVRWRGCAARGEARYTPDAAALFWCSLLFSCVRAFFSSFMGGRSRRIYRRLICVEWDWQVAGIR